MAAAGIVKNARSLAVFLPHPLAANPGERQEIRPFCE
jgi:hypothetical protein